MDGSVLTVRSLRKSAIGLDTWRRAPYLARSESAPHDPALDVDDHVYGHQHVFDYERRGQA